MERKEKKNGVSATQHTLLKPTNSRRPPHHFELGPHQYHPSWKHNQLYYSVQFDVYKKHDHTIHVNDPTSVHIDSLQLDQPQTYGTSIFY